LKGVAIPVIAKQSLAHPSPYTNTVVEKQASSSDRSNCIFKPHRSRAGFQGCRCHPCFSYLSGCKMHCHQEPFFP